MGRKKPIVIEVNDVLRGYNDHNKTKEIYSRLKSNLLVTKPLQQSPNGLVTISRNTLGRGSGYEWELYEQGKSLVLLEAWGSWIGYAPRGLPQPKLGDKTPSGYVDYWHFLRLTIHNPTSRIKSAIEDILKEFPVKAKNRAA